MVKLRFVARIFSLVAIAPWVGMACAQNYPNRPIRIISSPVGGGNDFVARLIAQGLTGPLGQPIIIENRPNNVTGQIVAKALPDGYTLLASSGSLWLAPLMQDGVPYDAVRDFAPVSLTAISPNILVVHPTVPASSIKELIALAKAKPGALNVATGPTASTNHLAAEMFKYMAGINITRVAYKGGGPALIGLVGGEVQLLFASASSVVPQMKSGKLKALAITSAKASALAPELPTVSAAGLPGYEVVGIDCMFAPARTPAAIIKYLNQEIVRVVNEVEVKAKFLGAGSEIVGSTPQQLAATVKAEIATWGKVIKEAGIRVE
jgi:tripartite-type tricarboxylate transporter receptor subunit TctC